jgi:hypothetical protein
MKAAIEGSIRRSTRPLPPSGAVVSWRMRAGVLAVTFSRSHPLNWSEIEAQWPMMKALLAAYWPKLTDADLGHIAGKRDRLSQFLHERYGLDATDAEAAICAFEKDVRRPGAVK